MIYLSHIEMPLFNILHVTSNIKNNMVLSIEQTIHCIAATLLQIIIIWDSYI